MNVVKHFLISLALLFVGLLVATFSNSPFLIYIGLGYFFLVFIPVLVMPLHRKAKELGQQTSSSIRQPPPTPDRSVASGSGPFSSPSGAGSSGTRESSTSRPDASGPSRSAGTPSGREAPIRRDGPSQDTAPSIDPDDFSTSEFGHKNNAADARSGKDGAR